MATSSRRPWRAGLLLAGLAGAGIVVATSALAPKPAFQSFPRWKASGVHGTPEAPKPFRAQPTFTRLSFKAPVDLVYEPGIGRWFIVEVGGQIRSFEPRADASEAPVFMDLRQKYPQLFRLYSIAPHPRFAQNGELYVFYWKTIDGPTDVHVSRFKTKPGKPLEVDLESEEILIQWQAGSHEGSALEFGPDGYLYVSVGDGSPPWPADQNQVGQNLSDVRAKILRIDVDKRAAGKGYAVPADNPFVDQPGALPEIWAYGLRNPWKMTFDSETGELWTGDVGHVFWEEVVKVEKGGNYGWSLYEGPFPLLWGHGRPAQDTRPDAKPAADRRRGPTAPLPSILNLDHETGKAASVTGGHVYRGNRFPELRGAYVFADYSLGTVWGLREAEGKVTWFEELADTKLGIVTIARDPAGELLLVDYSGGIYTLERTATPKASGQFPQVLSATGLFSSMKTLEPAPGVLPYSINASMWQDGAVSERVIGVPGEGSIDLQGYRPPSAVLKEYRYPAGTVFAKTYSLALREGDPGSSRRIETQLLHLENERWNAYTYRWNDAQTDAALVGADGASATFTVRKAGTGESEEVPWRFPGRAECLRCHNRFSGFIVAFDVPQLGLVRDYGDGRVGDQLETLRTVGLTRPKAFKERMKDAWFFERLADPYDDELDANVRARSYLQVNCSPCHNEGMGMVAANLTFGLDLVDTSTINSEPSQGTLGLDGARVITSGDALASMIYYRMAKSGAGRMPHIGSRIVDRRGLALLSDWIDAMPPLDPNAPVRSQAGAERAQLDALMASQTSASERDKHLAGLLGSVRGTLALMRAIDADRLPAETRRAAIAAALEGSPTAADLFSRFASREQRVSTLGPDFDPEDVLKQAGDVARGRELFRGGVGLCVSCHSAEGQGGSIGPSFHKLPPFDRAALLRNVVEPSLSIAEGFQQAATTTSLMPENLLASLSAPQAADLIDYVLSLRAPTVADAGVAADEGAARASGAAAAVLAPAP